MLEFVENLYSHSGSWGDPILLVSALLFIVGWIMLFTVRMIKRFIIFTAIALILPNSIGVVGYLDEADSLRDQLVQRGEEISDDMEDALEDFTFSPLYLGVLGSVLTGAVGVAGVARSRRRAKARS